MKCLSALTCVDDSFRGNPLTTPLQCDFIMLCVSSFILTISEVILEHGKMALEHAEKFFENNPLRKCGLPYYQNRHQTLKGQ